MWNLAFITDVLSLIFIVAGALQVFFASVGMNRFRSTLARVHAVTKPQTVGLIMVIIGVIFRLIGDEHFDVGQRGDVGMLLLLVLFALMTNPVTAQRLGRVSRREGLYGEEEDIAINEHPGDLHKSL
ncbi:monovalent cation/H(+) antiporter subunit G [Corynebacterium sp. MSK044]|uniref:monovalent cation/H(+) antiporter subunit G n=1 Tax=Corynebacterium sp. MSK044 TaxID=3050195 RepID=UPI00254FD6AF|nr:monovalent cation/H(+) antiporter subunit G [Corynebacterium sp. MSK044]MDK8796933.1 monovalent cation/H(+) antiporter subunit G [Corynebacterium sp. MSK044]